MHLFDLLAQNIKQSTLLALRETMVLIYDNFNWLAKNVM